MRLSVFRHHDLDLTLQDSEGAGPAILLQHGLCGGREQIAELTPDGQRVLTLECRGHVQSDCGPLAQLTIPSFTDDIIALLETLRLGPIIIGGVSMGAAISSRIAVLRPDLVRGLILIRPAWVTDDAPANMAPNTEVGELINREGGEAGLASFKSSATYRKLGDEAPDNLASLVGFFRRVPLEVTGALLTKISADGPGISEADLGALTSPTLVIGHERDAIHPISHARRLAALIPSAKFLEITPKAVDKARYLSDLKAAIRSFSDRLSMELLP